jgi:hypothetical protein
MGFANETALWAGLLGSTHPTDPFCGLEFHGIILSRGVSPRKAHSGFGSMAKRLYCWRCRMDIPMLEKHEWVQVEPSLMGRSNPSKRIANSTMPHSMRPRMSVGAKGRSISITG